ncbi:MAG: sodium:solute symporter [Bacteroidota bacterium]
MSILDWIILFGTLIGIVSYGVWKSRGAQDIEGYLMGDKSMRWYTIGLSIMATQASAITFLSTPGQAYTDGMRFIQFYFGLPIAMIIISVFFLPIYYRLKVYTAYEYLESRFDLKTRMLAALIFLIQRGLAAGITIYAPSIILSALLGWNLRLTSLIIGLLVIIYTVSGGTKAVTQTQTQQMGVMMGGMIVAGVLVIFSLPQNIGLGEALHVAGKMGRLNVVNFEFDLSDRYNFWSGITGAVFLFLSYFGTDQSQVQRYLTGRSLSESRLGLMMNGLLKVPMQFIILLIGALVFVFYQFHEPPVFFNKVQKEKLEASVYADELGKLEDEHTTLFNQKKAYIGQLVEGVRENNEDKIDMAKTAALAIEDQTEVIRDKVKALVKKNDEKAETNDKDYIFMNFVMNTLPVGVVGLLFAVIFSAAMSSTSSELNALGSTTTIDFYKRKFRQSASDSHYLNSSKAFTLAWGIIAIIFASTLHLFENLIQAVNLIGSLFYPIVLGIFVVAFFFKYVKSNAVFIGALIAQACVIAIHYLNVYEIAGRLTMGFLWYNAVGCIMVIVYSLIIQFILGKKSA